MTQFPIAEFQLLPIELIIRDIRIHRTVMEYPHKVGNPIAAPLPGPLGTLATASWIKCSRIKATAGFFRQISGHADCARTAPTAGLIERHRLLRPAGIHLAADTRWR